MPRRPSGDRRRPWPAERGTSLGDARVLGFAVHYFDRELGQFVERLRGDGLLDRTVLVNYGDHRAFLGSEAELPTLLGFDGWDDYHHFRVIKQTPLLIRLPGGASANRDEQPPRRRADGFGPARRGR